MAQSVDGSRVAGKPINKIENGKRSAKPSSGQRSFTVLLNVGFVETYWKYLNGRYGPNVPFRFLGAVLSSKFL
ncbi:MAG: hypothetical protein WBD01_01315, partial [Salaquimonas sp.]